MQSAINPDPCEPPTDATEPAEAQPIALRRWVAFGDEADIGPNDLVFDAPGVEAIAAFCAGIVLPTGDEQRVATLLAAGSDCVYLGEPALLDSAAVERLSSTYGGAHIGIYARVRRQTVSWSFETVSNADFKTVAPSHCEPAWEVLHADDSGSGTLASWWLKAMRDLGATSFLVQVDINDDTDLNLCAGLVEELGDALWIGPLAQPAPRLAEWIGYGQCRRLVLPASLYAHSDGQLILSGASA